GAEERDVELTTPEHVEAVSGRGVAGTVDGVDLIVGKAKLMADRGMLIP
ncbi:MAG: hypothetical protein GWM91_00410, partial [Actinobacteria bacterium]|nr:hypothetical protein [Actinomycetota bacterium]NIW25824.1 hypothetical protein [Actinomycetota bacterium]NIX48994.1 hypothetical protein [Actinomycetota bacterium]